MVYMKRIFLFLITNILVMITLNFAISVIASILKIPLHPGSYGGLLLFCAVFGTGGAFISLFLSKIMAKWAMGVKIIDPTQASPQMRDLVYLVHRLAKKADLPQMPEVGFYESPEINAFATGPSKSNSLVAVSTGLLDRMTPEEVEGVLGHEVAHIANGDMVTMTLIQGIVNAFTMFLARILSSIISSQVEDKNRYTVQFALTMLFDIVFTILGSLVVNYFSRQREFRADKGSAKVTSKQHMIAALRKLQVVHDKPWNQEGDPKPAFASLKISSSNGKSWLRLFSTHPSLEDRIQRLQESSF